MKIGIPLTLALLCGAGGQALGDDFLVAPGPNAAAEGSGGQNFPFNARRTSGVTTQRYQQVYAASEFTQAGGPLLVTSISFRPDARIFGVPIDFGQPFSTVISDIQINLSTTPMAVDGLSLTFAENVGADDRVMHAGPLALSSADIGPADGPKEFDIVIALDSPFLYQPGNGNLLLDVRNVSGELTTAFDAESTLGDGTSRVGTFRTGNVNSAVGDYRDSVGLITRFGFAAVPEPGGLALPAGAALPAVLLLARRRAAKARRSAA